MSGSEPRVAQVSLDGFDGFGMLKQDWKATSLNLKVGRPGEEAYVLVIDKLFDEVSRFKDAIISIRLMGDIDRMYFVPCCRHP